MKWKDTGAFEAWVEKHQIGPGMNDARRDPEGDLYSGYDGTVGEGWVPLIDKLATDLVALGWDRSMSQIKEKFGTLRFYADNVTDEMQKLIDDAELASETICENCGAPGSLRKGGWLLTLCDACDKEHKEK